MWVEFKKEIPPEGKVVDTKIQDAFERPRMQQALKRKGRLMFHPDMSMYVYYTPTHWWKESADKLYNSLTK